MICKICRNSEDNTFVHVNEMMFGFRDKFTYVECSKCGCLQISAVPENISKYYPSNYYSFRTESNPIKQMLKTKRDRYLLLKKGHIGKIVCNMYPNLALEAIGRIRLRRAARILDVGCGAGDLLRSLRDAGFTNLTGIDPYIEKDTTDGAINILKTTVHGLPEDQKFDLIISSHSFEHISDQLETLTAICKLLSDKSVCLLRIPVKTEYIWNRYSVDWVQIDAPRHLFLHTLKSFNLLVKQSNLSIREVHFDSTGFQFWGSEQYMRDIPLLSANSYKVSRSKSIFSAKQIAQYRKKARELNANQQGDQATFYLVRDANAISHGIGQ